MRKQVSAAKNSRIAIGSGSSINRGVLSVFEYGAYQIHLRDMKGKVSCTVDGSGPGTYRIDELIKYIRTGVLMLSVTSSRGTQSLVTAISNEAMC